MKVFTKQLVISICIIFLGLFLFTNHQYVSLEKHIDSAVSSLSLYKTNIILPLKNLFKQKAEKQLQNISFTKNYKQHETLNVFTAQILHVKYLSYFSKLSFSLYIFPKATILIKIIFLLFLISIIIRGPPCDKIDNTISYINSTSIRNPHIHLPVVFTFSKAFLTLNSAKISKLRKYFYIPATLYYQLIKIYIYIPSISPLHCIKTTYSALRQYEFHVRLKVAIMLSALKINFSNIKSAKFIYYQVGENYDKSLHFA